MIASSRLTRHDNTVRRNKSVDRQKSERRGTVNKNVIIILLNLIDIGSHNALSAHYRKKITFNAGQFHITGHQINTLVTVNDTVVIIKRFIVDYFAAHFVTSLFFFPEIQPGYVSICKEEK